MMIKRIIAWMIAAILCLSAFGMVACENVGIGANDSADGKIDAKVILVLEDKTEIPYDLHVTDGLTIRDALYEAGLIDEENLDGMFVNVIDGHKANAMEDGVTWLPCDKDGNQLEKENQIDNAFCFLDLINVDAGDVIYLKYYKVPNFD